MKKLVLSICFLAISAMGTAQSSDFKKDAREFVEVSGVDQTFLAQLEPVIQQIPAKKQAAFKKDIEALLPEYKDIMVDIMIKHYTHDEIKEILKFYNSPVGKKIQSKQNLIIKEGMEKGEQWGKESLMPIFMKYLQ